MKEHQDVEAPFITEIIEMQRQQKNSHIPDDEHDKNRDGDPKNPIQLFSFVSILEYDSRSSFFLSFYSSNNCRMNLPTF